MSTQYPTAGLFGSAAAIATGTITNPTAPKKPASVKSKNGLHCARCEQLWPGSTVSYDPADAPPLHRLVCEDGWTGEYLIWTITVWEGYFAPPVEDDPETA